MQHPCVIMILTFMFVIVKAKYESDFTNTPR